MEYPLPVSTAFVHYIITVFLLADGGFALTQAY